MRDTIDQFMWAFQAHFRLGVEYDAQQCLEAIGVRVQPQVVLVGFATSAERPHPVCVEPEWGTFRSHDLAGVLDRAADLFDQDPETKHWHSNARLHAAIQQRLHRHARGAAIRERLEAHGSLSDSAFFVSDSAMVRDYEVHVAIGVPRDVLSSLPVAGTEDTIDRVQVERSLITAIIAEIGRAAVRALRGQDPGDGVYVLERSRYDLVREAALRLTQSCVLRSGGRSGGDVFEHLNEITAESYEGSAARGYLLLASSDREDAVDVQVALDQPIHLKKTRAIRKLLEVTAPDFRLLVDDNVVYGIGKYESNSPEIPTMPVFELDVIEHATWQLAAPSGPLMRVAYGSAALPGPKLDPDLFRDAVQRLFPSPGDEDTRTLWKVVEAAAAGGHGTMLVIVGRAAEEASRLQAESTCIEPIMLTPELVTRVSAIDGAIILDPSGRCFAVGAILDGQASGAGDPGRGARYNSAVRYAQSYSDQVLLIVVSDHGTVDLVPPQRPRILPSRIDHALKEFEEAVATGDGELYAKARDRVEDLGFYLSEAQCEAANVIDAEEQSRRREAGDIVILGREFRPHHDMNDSYLLPE